MASLLQSLAPLSQYRDRRFPGTQEEFDECLRTTCTVYVGNLSFYTTEEQLLEVFAKAGEARRVIMGLDKTRLTPCGFAFVIYYTRADTEDCVRYLNGTIVDDRPIRVDFDWGFQEGRQYGRGRSGGQQGGEVMASWSCKSWRRGMQCSRCLLCPCQCSHSSRDLGEAGHGIWITDKEAASDIAMQMSRCQMMVASVNGQWQMQQRGILASENAQILMKTKSISAAATPKGLEHGALHTPMYICTWFESCSERIARRIAARLPAEQPTSCSLLVTLCAEHMLQSAAPGV
eukprot:jgi/Chlat1/8527/Chrsp80S07901